MKRIIALVLTLAIILSCGVTNVFAQAEQADANNSKNVMDGVASDALEKMDSGKFPEGQFPENLPKSGYALVDKEPLKTAIAAATTAVNANDFVVSLDGKDVEATKKWMYQEEKDIYITAIEAAQTVVDTATIQTQLDDAETALAEATTAFGAAKKERDFDITILKNAMAAATAAVNANIVVSSDGKDVEAPNNWVLPSEMVALTTAIEAAQEVVDNIHATQNDVDPVEKALVTAAAAFEKAKKARIFNSVALESALGQAVGRVNENDFVVSTDGKDVEATKKWMRQEEKDRYITAIQAARTASFQAKTQNQLDGVETALATATKAFDAAKKDGTKEEVVKPTAPPASNGGGGRTSSASDYSGTVDRAKAATAGDRVSVNIAKDDIVPATVLDSIAGKDITIVVYYQGKTYTVNGKNLKPSSWDIVSYTPESFIIALGAAAAATGNETFGGGGTYVVKAGDSLWDVAQRLLGNGARYPQIKAANNMTNDFILPGQKLVLPQ